MRRNTLWWACALIAMTFTVCVIVWFSIVRRGSSARGEPLWLETVAGRTVRRLAVPARARNAMNPIPLTPEVLADARAHFASHCALCHANDGGGNATIGQKLYPRAPDMRKEDTQELTDGELYYIIQNGIRLTGMPAWRETHTDIDSWKLVHFIRHLPTLTPEELQDMQRFNPKSRLKPISTPVQR